LQSAGRSDGEIRPQLLLNCALKNKPRPSSAHPSALNWNFECGDLESLSISPQAYGRARLKLVRLWGGGLTCPAGQCERRLGGGCSSAADNARLSSPLPQTIVRHEPHKSVTDLDAADYCTRRSDCLLALVLGYDSMNRFKRIIRSRRRDESDPELSPQPKAETRRTPQKSVHVPEDEVTPVDSKAAPAGVVPPAQPSTPIRNVTRQTTDWGAEAAKVADIFPGKQTRGLRVIRDVPHAAVDIVFIHGLTGDSFRTWNHKSGCHWPHALLPADVPNARVLTFGYDADVVKLFHGVGQSDLRNHASTLVVEFGQLRRGAEAKRSVILVVHSLGGLIAKKALCVSAESPDDEHKQLDRCTIGVCFLGTPHQGSAMADFATVITGVLRATSQKVNRSVVDVLRPDSEVLADLQQSFGSWLRKNSARFSLTCFFEEHETGLGGMVVPKRSASIDGYIPLPIPANHADMPKFASRDDVGYRRIIGQVRIWLEKASNEGQAESSGRKAAEAGGQSAGRAEKGEAPQPKEPQPEGPSEAELKECSKALSFPEMHSRGGSVRRPALDTCKWVLEHEMYKRWLDATGFLWILGHPGTGKTTLMKHIIENSPAMASSDEDNLRLTFFFYNLGAQLQRTAEGLLRCLLHGLLTAYPSCLDDLVKLYSQRAESMTRGWRWQVEELMGFLEKGLSAALQKANVHIFVDALDECKNDTQDTEDETDDIRHLIDFFRQLEGRLRERHLPHKFFVCFTCRHYPNLIPVNTEFRISVEQENTSDIERYAHQELSSDIGDSEKALLDALQQSIKTLASGSFQWVQLVTTKALKMHRDGKSRAKILKEVEALPRDLSRLYESILDSLDEDDRAMSLKLFQWVCFAKQPLTLAQLREALNVDTEAVCSSFKELGDGPDAIETDEQMEKRLPVLSGGLAEARAMPSTPSMLQAYHPFAGRQDQRVMSPPPPPPPGWQRPIVDSEDDTYVGKGLSRRVSYDEPEWMDDWRKRQDQLSDESESGSDTESVAATTPAVEMKVAGPPTSSQNLQVQKYNPPGIRRHSSSNQLPGRRAVYFIHQSVKDFLLLSGFSKMDKNLSSPQASAKSAQLRLTLSCLQYTTMSEPTIICDTTEAFYGKAALEQVLTWVQTPNLRLPGIQWPTYEWQSTRERILQCPTYAGQAELVKHYVKTYVRNYDPTHRPVMPLPPHDKIKAQFNGSFYDPITRTRHPKYLPPEPNAAEPNARALPQWGPPSTWANGQPLASPPPPSGGPPPPGSQPAAANGEPPAGTLCFYHIAALVGDLEAKRVFFPYALERWIDHAADLCLAGHESLLDEALDMIRQRVSPTTLRVYTALGGWMLKAVRENQPVLVRKLLNSKRVELPLNVVGHQGKTPLMEAISRGFTEITAMLVETPGLERHLQGASGSALFHAVRTAKPELVQLLIDRGFHEPVDSAPGYLTAALVEVCRTSQNLDIAKALLKAMPADDKTDALSMALFALLGNNLYTKDPTKKLEIVQLLLEHGADANSRDVRGRTPLGACFEGLAEKEVAELLLKHGAKVFPENIEFSWSPLGRILSKNRNYVIGWLMERGIDIRRGAPRGRLLCLAVVTGDFGAVGALVDDRRVEEDINGVDALGNPALHCALMERFDGQKLRVSILSYGRNNTRNLIQHDDTDINAVSDAGYSPLMLAVRLRHKRGFRRLFDDERIKINVQTRKGTALYVAVKRRRVYVVKKLLKDRETWAWVGLPGGHTPLHLAVEQGDKEMVELIVSYPDVGINHQDGNGMTPIMLAALHGMTDIVTVLLETNYAELGRRDARGRTALSLAAQAVKWRKPVPLHDGYVRIVAKLCEGHTSEHKKSADGDVNLADDEGRTPLDWALLGLAECEGRLRALDDDDNDDDDGGDDSWLVHHQRRDLRREVGYREDMVAAIRRAGGAEGTWPARDGESAAPVPAALWDLAQAPGAEDVDGGDESDDLETMDSDWVRDDSAEKCSTCSSSSNNTSPVVSPLLPPPPSRIPGRRPAPGLILPPRAGATPRPPGIIPPLPPGTIPPPPPGTIQPPPPGQTLPRPPGAAMPYPTAPNGLYGFMFPPKKGKKKKTKKK
jgi:ankyrin repeat protein